MTSKKRMPGDAYVVFLDGKCVVRVPISLSNCPRRMINVVSTLCGRTGFSDGVAVSNYVHQSSCRDPHKNEGLAQLVWRPE